MTRIQHAMPTAKLGWNIYYLSLLVRDWLCMVPGARAPDWSDVRNWNIVHTRYRSDTNSLVTLSPRL